MEQILAALFAELLNTARPDRDRLPPLLQIRLLLEMLGIRDCRFAGYRPSLLAQDKDSDGARVIASPAARRS